MASEDAFELLITNTEDLEDKWERAVMEHLLEEFPPVSKAEWEAAIARDLNGADYDKRLIWSNEEGFAVKPYYRAEDLKNLACVDSAPGTFPYMRGGRSTVDWQIREEIDVADAEGANRAARAAIAAGAEEIAFSRISLERSNELGPLLANLGEIPIHFSRADEPLLGLLCERLGDGRKTARISTGCDAVDSIDFAAEVINAAQNRAAPKGLVPFTIHGEAFEEAGATATEEVGFTLAAGVDFLAEMQERGVDLDRAAGALEFSFTMGSNFFFQIAKLRAFRIVWARAVEEFGGSRSGALACIAARTSRWNKTIYDPHVNILRATTEGIAAALGGADAVTVSPFDACYRQPDEASRRLARNTQLLLRHEAWMGRVADPGGGSYYLETLTDLLAREGWKRMQEIERRGGYRRARADGFVTLALERSMAERKKSLALRRRVLVGTNQFANPAEQALGRCEIHRMSETKRGAQPFEEMRLRTERHAMARMKAPRVMLAEFGDLRVRVARSNFAANFFACAGFGTVMRRFRTTSEIAEAEGDLIVLCGAEAEYVKFAAQLLPKMKALGRATPVAAVGNPENAKRLAAAGIADLLHLRCNCVELLTKWQERLGMTS
jgi:methylmalonyl-CoA mutase